MAAPKHKDRFDRLLHAMATQPEPSGKPAKGLNAIIKSGKQYSDDEAKGILVKPVYGGCRAT